MIINLKAFFFFYRYKKLTAIKKNCGVFYLGQEVLASESSSLTKKIKKQETNVFSRFQCIDDATLAILSLSMELFYSYRLRESEAILAPLQAAARESGLNAVVNFCLH